MKKTENLSALLECVNFIQNNKKDIKNEDSALTIEEGEASFVISDDNIFPIPEIEKNRNLGFVDGGTEPIIIGSDFSISICRVAGIIINTENVITPKKIPLVIEFYSATISEKKNNGLTFRTRIFSRENNHKTYLPQKDIEISYKDPSIRMQGKFLMPIENHGGIAMRFAEWTYAKHFILNELSNEDIFIRDGSLQTGYPDEIELAKSVYSTGLKKNVYITGLSKSCRLYLKKSGGSLNSYVNSIGNSKYPKINWYYYPTMKLTKVDNQADLLFVRLNKDSPYSFRFDIYIEQSNTLNKQKREDIISNIANNSNDPLFLGYPYGLIKADQLARISKKEIESYKIQLLAEFDKEIYNKFILPRLWSVDAHDILNKIRK